MISQKQQNKLLRNLNSYFHKINSKTNRYISMLLCVSFILPISFAKDYPDLSSTSSEAANLFKQGKLNDAISMQHKALLNSPQEAQTNASSHALLSFLAWKQGNIILALEEGEKAVSISPKEIAYSINLALMKESLTDFDSALRNYQEISNYYPESWTIQINEARCLFKKGAKNEALSILTKIIKTNPNSAAANISVSELCLESSENKLALETSIKAAQCAKSKAEKDLSDLLTLLTLLRENKFEDASLHKKIIFNSKIPYSYEVYVRAASAILNANSPRDGIKLLNAAQTCLVKPEDAEGFYRLGRIFQEKALNAQKSKSNIWLDLASKSYQRAIFLDNLQARYHLALASIQAKNSSLNSYLDEIKNARNLNQFDFLSKFIMDETLKQLALQNQTNCNSSKKNNVFTSSLIKVSFDINGLNCGCHIGKLEELFTKIDGVAFVNVTRQEPLKGIIFLDNSTTSTTNVFTNCLRTFASDQLILASKTKSKISFDSPKIEHITSLEEMIRLALDAREGNILQFFDQFKTQEPVLPIDLAENHQLISSRP